MSTKNISKKELIQLCKASFVCGFDAASLAIRKSSLNHIADSLDEGKELIKKEVLSSEDSDFLEMIEKYMKENF